MKSKQSVPNVGEVMLSSSTAANSSLNATNMKMMLQQAALSQGGVVYSHESNLSQIEQRSGVQPSSLILNNPHLSNASQLKKGKAGGSSDSKQGVKLLRSKGSVSGIAGGTAPISTVSQQLALQTQLGNFSNL